MVKQWTGHGCKLRLVVNPRTRRSELTMYDENNMAVFCKQYTPWDEDRATREAFMLAQCSLLEQVA